MTDSVALALFSGVLLAIVGVGEMLRGLAGWRPEDSRRVVHAGTGLAVVATPYLFEQPDGIYVLAGLFVLVNVIAVRRRLLPGMHGIQRESWGTVVFPLALIVALFTCWTMAPERVFALQAAFAILALADPAASLIGSRREASTAQKSAAGSAAFFCVALVVGAITLAVTVGHALDTATVIMIALGSAAAATAAESLFTRGWDNLFIVIAVLSVCIVITELPGADARLLLALGIAPAFGFVSWKSRLLSGGGAIAAGLLGMTVITIGGWLWTLPGLAFFFLASGLSLPGRGRKAAAEKLSQKGSRRDASQVFANGGVAWLLIIAYVFWPNDLLFWGFVAAFAASAADTWATEIGTWVGGPTRSLWTGRRVPPGTSGGVSVAGTLAALGGAASVFGAAAVVIALSSASLDLLRFALVIIGSGFLGSLVDSALGATLQAVYRTPGSDVLTEKSVIDGVALDAHRGVTWMDNDRVNLLGSSVGAGLGVIAAALL